MKNILVVWDSKDDKDPVLAKALVLSEKLKAGVSVIAVSAGQDIVMPPGELLDRINRLYSWPIPVASLDACDERSLGDLLKAKTSEKPYDLLMKSAYRPEDSAHSYTDWQLVRDVSLPVMLCRKRPWKSGGKVMATVDVLSDSAIQLKMNQDVLQWANLCAQWLDFYVHVAHVIEINPVLDELEIVQPETILKKKEGLVRSKLEQILPDVLPADSKLCIAAGIPSKEIASLASKQKIDMVVLGSVGRKGIKGVLLGNTAEKMIKYLNSDLLVIRPR